MYASALDIFGVFIFALSGGMRGVECRLDVFGVVFLAFASAVAGGLMRDLIIGATPPAAFATWHYLVASTVAGVCCYASYRYVARLTMAVSVFDAIGMGVYSVVGAEKALSYGLPPLMAAVLGMVSAIGGGMARDLLTARTPMVLRTDIYAVAALLGGMIVAFGMANGFAYEWLAPLGAIVSIGLRLMALWRNWSLPPAPLSGSERSGAE
jgi:uncharacterized membrane protein YeiH